MLKNKRALAILVAIAFLSLIIIACALRGGGTASEVDIAIPEASTSAGPIFVIDPGHGGSDPGSHGVIHGTNVYEAPYVADVAERLARRLRASGGTVLLTRTNARVGIVENDPWNVLPLARDDIFQSGSLVRARASGMEERLDVVRHALHAHPGRRVIFVSIHFDSEGTSSLQGAFVVASDPESGIANALASSFVKSGRGRKRHKDGWHTYASLIPNIRNLYILREDKNPVQDRVLVELGNFKNPHDLYSIRDPKVREAYASDMAAPLLNSAAGR